MDRYYTSDSALRLIKSIIDENDLFEGIDLLVDFSAGDDRFCRMFDMTTESYDISPRSHSVNKANWFEVDALCCKYESLAIGLNPPFGYKGQTARKFVEHAAQFSPDIIVLIVPRSFKFADGYSSFLEVNLEEDAFFDPDTGNTFCFPTKFMALRKGEKKPKSQKSRKKEREFKIRVSGQINEKTQMLIRRAGVYANEQFYCIVDDLVYFMDRGRWFPGVDWKDNNHSVQEGGDVTKIHGSSNPKRTGSTGCSKTGWNWYKIDFDEKQHMKELKRLAQFIYDNPSKAKSERSKDISILSKSSPPNINTAYLYPLMDSFFKASY